LVGRNAIAKDDRRALKECAAARDVRAGGKSKGDIEDEPTGVQSTVMRSGFNRSLCKAGHCTAANPRHEWQAT